MDEERAGREERRRKKKVKRREGKAKDELERCSGEEAMEIDSAADAPENGDEKTVMGIEEGKRGHKSQKEKGRGKEKKSKVNDSVDSCSRKHGVEKEQAKNSGLLAENPCSEHVKGDTSKGDLKKDKKTRKKKKGKEAETTGQKQTLDSTIENVGSVHAERDRGEGRQSSKSKKSKQKREYGEPVAEGSAGDQIVSSKDKKRKKDHSVVLEDGSQIDMTKMGEKREGKKKRRKESDKIGPDLSQNASAGGEEADVDGKNDKKKKKGKERIAGGKREKEKAARLKDMGRRVSFADDVEVFSIDGGDDEEGGRSDESKLVHGQRFTPEEDATLMEAIMNYAEMKQLGEKGREMIRASSKHPELKGCWADIGKSLPHRPSKAIYKRARILLYRSDERKWTQEEYEKIRRFVENHGTDWKTLAKELGKSDIHVKDTWRRIKPKNLKTGAWTQDEYQNLFDLVNLDLRVKAHQENDPGHRVLRDNISWEAISDKLTTRNHKNCCLKWYMQLASPLVKQGIWADADDYRLLEALQKVDAVCVEDVDWESLLDHRSGEVCRQRWNQMVRNIGGHKEKTFIEQVEVLSKRYCPEMLDYRK